MAKTQEEQEREDQENFERAKAERERAKREKAEKDEKKNNTFSFDEVKFAGLEVDRYKQFRFMGGLLAYPRKSYSPKIVRRSKILGDSDKSIFVNWPSREEKPDWILWKIYDKVMAYKWNKEKGKNGEREYLHQNSHPSLFSRVSKNNKSNQYEKGWYPETFLVCNVLDRDLTAWHEKEKHTALISKKINVSGEIEYPAIGIPLSLYNNIYDDIVGVYGTFSKYDVVIQKLDDDPYYKVYHSFKDQEKTIAKFKNEADKIRKYDEYSTRPLTESELNYEMYDLDRLYGVTSYSKILKNLKLFIAQVDMAFNTKYLQELEELASKEQSERKNTSGDSKESEESYSSREEKEEVEEDDEEFILEEYLDKNKDMYKGLEFLTDENKEMIIGVESSGQFKYDKKNSGRKFKCANKTIGCNFISPESYTHCPLCGYEF